MMIGALRGGASHATRMTIAMTLLVMGVIGGCWALLSLRDAAPQVALSVIVMGGSAVTLGFALAPVIVGAPDPLDPRRFVLLGMPVRSLAFVLAVAGFISIPIAALTTLAISAAAVWTHFGAGALPVFTGTFLGLLTCVLLARVCMSLASAYLNERRSRELSGLFVLAVVVVVVPVGVFLASLEWGGAVPTQLAEAVDALAITPVGAPWAYAGFVAAGSDHAVRSLLISLLSVVALAALWLWLVRRALTTTERPTTNRERAGLGWFAVAPGTPGGAVAARSLLYWFRDRRYVANLLVIPLAAVVTIIPLLVAGVPLEYAVLIPVPFAALFLGWLPHNDLAYDSTALWMHVSSGIRGIADRLGRLVPLLLIGVPLLAVSIPFAVSQHGRWAMLPALTGVCVSLFFSALGFSSISSVVAPYAVSHPGESPFQQPQRTGPSGVFAQALVFAAAVAVSLPALWLAWLALTEDVGLATPALWAGVLAGGGVFAIGLAIGSVVFERRGDRLMEFTESA